jgi:hypothetical protein
MSEIGMFRPTNRSFQLGPTPLFFTDLQHRIDHPDTEHPKKSAPKIRAKCQVDNECQDAYSDESEKNHFFHYAG